MSNKPQQLHIPHETVEGAVDGKCEFCGGKITAGYVKGVPMVMHNKPFCERFMADESPVDFLKANNDKREKRETN